MSTKIKPELSKKNPHYISKHRFYELRNYCLQYYEWKAALRNADGYNCKSRFIVVDPNEDMMKESYVEKAVITREDLQLRIHTIELAADVTDKELAPWILKGVTIPASYDYLSMREGIPCSRDTYYKRYRKFFCVLDKLRG